MASLFVILKSRLLLIIAISVLSLWTWEILKESLLTLLLGLILTYLLIDFLLEEKRKTLKTALTLLLIFILFIFSFINSFDNNLLKTNEIEKIQIKDRYQYFFRELGYFYANNRAFVYYINNTMPALTKYFNNQAYLFDINTYFPSKYPLIFLPFLLIGLYNFLKISNLWIILTTIMVILLSGFVDTRNIRGMFTFYPLFSALIFFGMVKTLKILR